MTSGVTRGLNEGRGKAYLKGAHWSPQGAHWPKIGKKVNDSESLDVVDVCTSQKKRKHPEKLKKTT